MIKVSIHSRTIDDQKKMSIRQLQRLIKTFWVENGSKCKEYQNTTAAAQGSDCNIAVEQMPRDQEIVRFESLQLLSFLETVQARGRTWNLFGFY